MGPSMTERGTWEDYQKWDAARREAFPLGRHWIYRTKIEEFTVAEFCPLSGTARIGKTGK